MAAKLRSILRRTYSPLALKAALFGAGLLVLPPWAFVVVALYLYCVPRFRMAHFGFPFLVLMFFALTKMPGFLDALLFAVLFYLLLGVKDMAFVDKQTPHAVLILLLVFLACIRFFGTFVAWDSAAVFGYAPMISATFFFLCRGFLRHTALVRESAHDMRRGLLGFGIAAFLMGELLLVAVFLPLNFLYQSAILIMAAAVLFDLTAHYIHAGLVRERALLNFSAFFVFFVILIGSAKWTL